MTPCKKEPYSPMVIPFDYESPVKQMQLDKFYEHVIDNINDYDRYGDPICPNNPYIENFNAEESNQPILNAKVYYDKYREYQDKVTNLENLLVYTQDVLDAYKKNLIFCRRKLTMEPIVANCVYPTSVDPYYDVTGNTASGVGVSTPKF